MYGPGPPSRRDNYNTGDFARSVYLCAAAALTVGLAVQMNAAVRGAVAAAGAAQSDPEHAAAHRHMRAANEAARELQAHLASLAPVAEKLAARRSAMEDDVAAGFSVLGDFGVTHMGLLAEAADGESAVLACERKLPLPPLSVRDIFGAEERGARAAARKAVAGAPRRAQCAERGRVDAAMAQAVRSLAVGRVARVDYAAGGVVLRGAEHTSPTLPLPAALAAARGPDRPFAPRAVGADDAVQVRLGECWPIAGGHGFVTVRLFEPVRVDAVTVEHVHSSVAVDPGAAPAAFSVYVRRSVADAPRRLLADGRYASGLGAPSAQTFPADLDFAPNERGDELVTFQFHSNHGAPHTCIYRLRVHGKSAQR